MGESNDIYIKLCVQCSEHVIILICFEITNGTILDANMLSRLCHELLGK